MVESPNKASQPTKGPRGRRLSHRTKPEAVKKAKGKKKISKKPKHLHRKLATASDAAEQTLIRQQMEILEATKRKLSHQKQSKSNNIHPKQAKKQQPQPVVLRDTIAASMYTNPSKLLSSSPGSLNKLEPSVELDSSRQKKETTPADNDPSLPKVDASTSSFASSSPTATPTDTEASDKTTTTTASVSVGRQRGKRRRGRKDTSQIVKEEQAKQTSDKASSSTTVSSSSPPVQTKDPSPRRCMGRKPVTDFVVGETYPGTVVYTKPFGIFIDINCHSDAFCHVSRLADTFVDDPFPLFSPGTNIPALRIVQVDRAAKRITGSLQTSARAQEELASAQARQERKEKHRLQQQQEQNNLEKRRQQQQQQHKTGESSTELHREHTATVDYPQKKQKRSTSVDPSHFSSPTTPSANNTKEDDKRARKLARRAARRAAKEGEDIDPTQQM